MLEERINQYGIMQEECIKVSWEQLQTSIKTAVKEAEN